MAERGPAGPAPVVVNHVGLCVTDLDRIRAFYEQVFGFVEARRMEIPDLPAGRLLRVSPPLGLTAVYLRLGGFVLELVHFDRDGNAPARERPFTEPGLTHLSFTVDDLPAALERVRAAGGEVLDDTEIPGVAVMVRDPDGQVLELLSGSVQPTTRSR